MILHDFPNLQWLKKQAEDAFATRKAWDGSILPAAGWPTVILNVNTSQTYRDNIRGPLSIFTNLHGESEVEAGRRNVKIKEGFLYVTNRDQYYTLAVNKVKTETLNIHFSEYFVDQVFESINNDPDKLLEMGFFNKPLQRIEFYNKLTAKDENCNRILRQISTMKNDALLFEEKLYELIIVLLKDHNVIRTIREQLPAIKNTTREEITRRLINVTDYIHSYYDKNLTLDELAHVACLSKFHFLRLFKFAFNQTPHQFITSVKIERAKALLKKTSHEVLSISRSLGFDNASSFSRLFYNHVGIYPTQYR